MVWISIDEDDDDANRLFATLVNALCTCAGSRILIVLYDLHRISRPDACALLDSLVERLPDHVALLMGTCIEPPLQLGRWRAHGELGEFSLDDLRFTEEEAARLAAGAPHAIADQRTVHDALARTGGWAVGLTMLLQSRWGVPSAGRGGRGASGDAALRNLFAYPAKKVLGDLPLDLQEFVLRTSFVVELEPRLCRALTGREDIVNAIPDALPARLTWTACTPASNRCANSTPRTCAGLRRVVASSGSVARQ